MARKRRVVVVTYYGLDGACAGAMALLAHPSAEVVATSAARIGQSLCDLAESRKGTSEIHICGVGVHCNWEEVARPALKLRRGGSTVTWYCGRGYLKSREEDFARFCTSAFEDQATNTQCVCTNLGLGDHPNTGPILQLARHDPNIGKAPKRPSEEQAFWIDLINASVAQYFKYQDEDAYRATIRKLSALSWDKGDERDVAVFRGSGFRHVLWGKSRAMSDLRGTIRKCAELDEPVLISGESGVGKEYVAHLLHERSARAMGPFIPVNCALFAGNAALANSVLFGHVRGAFTGAIEDRSGAFVSADSGMLFLDEVSELPAEVQAKLLRVLEDGWVTPEGSDKPRKVDVRVLAATNRQLPALVREGRFRADLYHRLDILQIRVPSLRQHIEDVGQIAQSLLPSLTPGEGKKKLAAKDLQLLQGYDWPGNVRQLIKVLKRATYLGMPLGEVIEEERSLGVLVEVEKDMSGRSPLWPLSADEIQPMREVRRQYAARALELNGGNITATAKMLGVAVNTLRSYLGRS